MVRTRWDRLLSRAFAALLATITLVTPLWADDMGVGCGHPERGGFIQMYIKVVSPGGGVTLTAVIELAVSGPSWTAEEKALFFRLSLPPGFEDKVALGGTGNQVTASGLNGWRIAGIGIDNDETNEADQILSYVTPTDELALCSLSGTASGLTASGTPGMFRMTVAGRTVLVPTTPGMPAQIIEQQVLSQLLAQGVTARLATPADLALLDTVQHDGIVLAIEGLDASGLTEQLRDTGLAIDVAGLASPLSPLPPDDPHASIAGTEPDGSYVSFGAGGAPPIPAGFFDPGSDPFDGMILLQGSPIDQIQLGDASTLVRRSGNPFLPEDPPGSMATVPIEIVSLSLVSVNPITVTYGGGHLPELWDVRVGLSVMPPAGPSELRAVKTHVNGGTFSAVFHVRPLFTFTRIDDGVVRDLDTGVHGLPPLQFMATDGHWVHELGPALEIIAPSDGAFVPGVEEVMPGDPFSQELRRLHADEITGAARHTVFPARFEPLFVPAVAETGLRVRVHPNPFKGSARIDYVMPDRGPLSIRIYDVQGELVRTLAGRVVDPGTGSVMWDGTDDRGGLMASGVYLCEVTALGRSTAVKIALAR